MGGVGEVIASCRGGDQVVTFSKQLGHLFTSLGVSVKWPFRHTGRP